jgi:hypothetical protein
MLVDWVEGRDTWTNACGRLVDLFEQDQGICRLTEGNFTRFCHSHRRGVPDLLFCDFCYGSLVAPLGSTGNSQSVS